MTAQDAFEAITQGGATDFQRALTVCNTVGSYCLIGGLAINCYVEPVYTLDADLVVTTTQWPEIRTGLEAAGFRLEVFPHSCNAQFPGSALRVQLTTDPRYQAFVARAQPRDVLGVSVRVAALADLVQGKLWAWADPTRRASKRQKDQADLIRIAESFPEFLPQLPASLRQLLA